ncbi:MAG: hypothetical protein KF770_21505 [Anaerolineae bacterium]|nr:hypothetical protein [Anaerolineae bacterium]
MDQSSPSPGHLFVIRIWAQEIEYGRTEWRGRVQYVPTGEVHYFREWPDMLAIVQRMLPGEGGSVSSEQ